MNEPLRLTIDYKTGDDGWIIASVPEVPGAHSQGRTRKEARANVIDALRGVLELRLGEHAINEPGGDRERLELLLAEQAGRAQRQRLIEEVGRGPVPGRRTRQPPRSPGGVSC